METRAGGEQERVARDGQFPAQHTATDPSLHLSPAETQKLQLWWQAKNLIPCCKTTSGSVIRARDPTSLQSSFPILKMGAAPLSFRGSIIDYNLLNTLF